MKNCRRVAVSAAAILSVAGMAQAQSFFETFESPLPGEVPANWIVSNQSNPLGETQWGAALNPDVPPHGGVQALYANYLNGDGLATLSDWLVTPMVTLRNGDTLKFWTTTYFDPFFPDRLQVRMSTSGASTNTGVSEVDVGDFTTLLLDINPSYLVTGYPSSNTQFTIGPLTGLPGGGVTGRFAFRYFVEGGGPLGDNSDVINVDDIDYTSATDVPGACCFTDGTCTVLTSAACAAQAGTYSGNGVTCAAANCPQPPSGACCADNGTCTFVTSFACTASGGTWSGAGVTCAAANCQAGWVEVGDAGDLPATAQTVSGPANASVPFIAGNISSAGEGDMYQIKICDAANFVATTVGNGNLLDTILSLYKADGTGVSWNDDEVGGETLQSTITSQFIPGAGNYYLHVSQWNKIPFSASGNIWTNDGIAAPYRSERAPDGPGAAGAITGWNVPTGTDTGAYRIALTGACFVSTTVACYPNCDLSTAAPILNANDFQCFLNEFAAQSSYANCDNSTAPPVLNANDFQCFLNQFAGGCS